MSNAATVQHIYEAFGRGDVPAILAKLSEDVIWEYGSAPNDVPWLMARRGRANVAGFFESLSAVEIHHFIPTLLLAERNVVVALIEIEATVKATGKRIREEDYTHVWRFDDDGLVIKFRHVVDSFQHVMAYRGH